MQAVFVTARGKTCKRLWALDADLAAAFDRIDHSCLLGQLGTFPAGGRIGQWLKAGVIDRGRFAPTEQGCPQGGVITPPTQWITLAHVTLRVGCVVVAAAAGGWFPDGDAVAYGDLLRADEDVLDQQPQRSAARPSPPGSTPTPPPALKARLLAAFDLQILWNKTGQQATVFAEITDATLQALPAILDPAQDGYHDTSTDTGTSDPAPMWDLGNTPRSGRESHSWVHRAASTRTSRICSPYLASLVSPTPFTRASSSSVDGGAAAICRRVASWKITYAGMPCSFATAARQPRSRSNTASASGASSACGPGDLPRGVPAATPALAPAFGPRPPRPAGEGAGRAASRRNRTCRSPRSTSALRSVSASVP